MWWVWEVWGKCDEGKPLVSRFPYHSFSGPTQYLLLPHNGPSSFGILVLIAISTPRSKLQCSLWEFYVSLSVSRFISASWPLHLPSR